MSTGRAPLRLACAGIDAVTPRPPWRCRVLRSHVWLLHSTDDGGRYEACGRCGIDRGPVGFVPMTTPPWPGYR